MALGASEIQLYAELILKITSVACVIKLISILFNFPGLNIYPPPFVRGCGFLWILAKYTLAKKTLFKEILFSAVHKYKMCWIKKNVLQGTEQLHF